MSSGGVDPPRPPLNENSENRKSGKKKRYVVRLLPPRDSLPSSTSSPSTVSMPIRASDVIPTPSPPSTEGIPSPCPANATGPSTGPTSTPSPSPGVGNMPNDEDRPNLVIEDPPLNDRPTVTLINGAFHPSKVAAKAITLSIRQQFVNPWPTWGAIPKDHQELFFQRFKRQLVWRSEEEDEIKKVFNSKASHRLSEMFCDARNENKRPYWIGERVWNDLLSHWNAPEYRSKCEKAKKNRASEKGGCMHTGGSISLQDHAIRLSQELGRSAYVDEIFQQTHLRKDTGEFVDDRSRQTHENFEARLSQARSDVQSSVGESEMTPLDPAEEQRLRTRCWLEAAGPINKGRLYGTGDLVHTYKCGDNTFMQHLQGSSSNAIHSAEINQIKEELRQSKEELRQSKEALRQSTEQMRVFQSVVLQFLPPEARNIMQQQQQQQQHNDESHDQQQQNNDQPSDDQQQQLDDQQRRSGNDYFDY